jgi:small subunit ribosomal protein S8
MVVTDPIADMLTVIRNANSARKQTAEIKASGINEEILKILKDTGYISNFKRMKDNKQGTIKIYMLYEGEKKAPMITGLKRISKPGFRRYVKNEDIPYVLNGIGLAILSTSRGIVTDRQARKEKIGGEVICYVW